jgi:hypothetical protein
MLFIERLLRTKDAPHPLSQVDAAQFEFDDVVVFELFVAVVDKPAPHGAEVDDNKSFVMLENA